MSEGDDQYELEEGRRGDGIAVALRHADDRESTVEVDIWPGQALIRWLGESHNTRDYRGDAADGEWPRPLRTGRWCVAAYRSVRGRRIRPDVAMDTRFPGIRVLLATAHFAADVCVRRWRTVW